MAKNKMDIDFKFTDRTNLYVKKYIIVRLIDYFKQLDVTKLDFLLAPNCVKGEYVAKPKHNGMMIRKIIVNVDNYECYCTLLNGLDYKKEYNLEELSYEELKELCNYLSKYITKSYIKKYKSNK